MKAWTQKTETKMTTCNHKAVMMKAMKNMNFTFLNTLIMTD